MAEAQVLFEWGGTARRRRCTIRSSPVGGGDERRRSSARSAGLGDDARRVCARGRRRHGGAGDPRRQRQALGTRSGYGRDQRLHHHVRALLLAARGKDEAAIEEFRRAIYSPNQGYTRTNVELAAVLLRRTEVRKRSRCCSRRYADRSRRLTTTSRGPRCTSCSRRRGIGGGASGARQCGGALCDGGESVGPRRPGVC